jgi:signal transduction histidine kinase
MYATCRHLRINSIQRAQTGRGPPIGNNQKLEIKNQELIRMNEELTSFVYVVSHDFKEPIRKIQVFANRQREEGKSIEQILDFHPCPNSQTANLKQ